MEIFESPKIMEIEIKTELQEPFYAATEIFKTEDTETLDPKPAILCGDYESQRSDDGTEYSAAMTQPNEDIPLRLLCRLCTIPDNSMTDIFGVDAKSRNILSMINHCLPVMIKETDTLPRRVCRSCLEELERCYRFHQTVAEAEKQLLAFCRLPSSDLKKMETNLGTFSRYNIDAALQTTSDTSMRSRERAATANTPAEQNVSLQSLRPGSDASILEMGHKNNPQNPNSREIGSSNSMNQNLYSNTEMLYPQTTSVSQIVQQSTYQFGAAEQIQNWSVAYGAQGTGAEHLSTRKIDPAIYEHPRTQERRYRCTKCAKAYKTKDSLSKHSRLHTGEGLFICKYCGLKCVSKAHGIIHQRIHTGERSFKCSMCERGFALLSNLERHKATVHSERKDYPCPLCDKSFKALQVRKMHMLVHTYQKERRLWQCDHCKKSYKNRSTLVIHLKTCREWYRKK